jgi:hypothetical protein
MMTAHPSETYMENFHFIGLNSFSFLFLIAETGTVSEPASFSHLHLSPKDNMEFSFTCYVGI